MLYLCSHGEAITVLGENFLLQELWGPPTLLWASLYKAIPGNSSVPRCFSGKVAKDLSSGPYEKWVDIGYVSPGKEFS